MAIEFLCPRCAATIQVPNEAAGKKGNCPQCHGRLMVPDPLAAPAPPPAAPPPVPPEPPPIPDTLQVEIQCPHCQSEIKVRASRAGHKIQCPNCDGRLQIPHLPPEALQAAANPAPPPQPVPVVAPDALIEFQCARCQATIQVPVAASGRTGSCPQCNCRLQVPLVAVAPAPPLEAPPFEAPLFEAPPPEAPLSTGGIPDFGASPDLPPLDPLLAKRLKRARRTSVWGKLLLPVICIALIAFVGVFVVRMSAPKLEGNLEAARIAELDIPPVSVDSGAAGVSAARLRGLVKQLEEQPSRLATQLMSMEFRGSEGKLLLTLNPGLDTTFVRVDPRVDKTLWTFAIKNADQLDVARKKELTQSLPGFVKVLEKFAKDSGGSPEQLLKYRNSVGIPSLVEGLGYHVLAVVDEGETHPCVYEDSEHQLYFLLPKKITRFSLRGREVPPGEPSFPGNYQVHITE